VGQHAVKMRVRIHEAGRERVAARLEHLVLWEELPQLRIGCDGRHL